MNQLFKEIQKESRVIFALAVAIFLILQGISAPVFGQWTGPTAAPPEDVPQPIFGSYTSQTIGGILNLLSGDLTVVKNLAVSGNYVNTGNVTIGGVFTMGSGANVCRVVAYGVDTQYKCCCDGEPGCPSCTAAGCCNHVNNPYYVVAVMDASDVVQNPGEGSLPTSGKILCCKNAD